MDLLQRNRSMDGREVSPARRSGAVVALMKKFGGCGGRGSSNGILGMSTAGIRRILESRDATEERNHLAVLL